METKTLVGLLGTSAAAMVVGLGSLVTGVSAQSSTTPPAAATAPTANATPGATTPGTTAPGDKGNWGGRGGHGPHRGGMEGMEGMESMGGFGRFGGAGATADSANRSVTDATSSLTTAKSDLTYSTGKMDTANVQKWLSGADTLLKSAQTAVTGTQYERAGDDARAAEELTKLAERSMAQTLGADKLPSYSQNSNHRGFGGPRMGAGTATTTITQAQASRILAQTYNHLVSQKALIKDSTASTYLADAQAAYKAAYDSYNAGKYSDAANSARQAGELAGVARTLQAAADAPNNADAPVTVPAPTF